MSGATSGSECRDALGDVADLGGGFFDVGSLEGGGLEVGSLEVGSLEDGSPIGCCCGGNFDVVREERGGDA